MPSRGFLRSLGTLERSPDCRVDAGHYGPEVTAAFSRLEESGMKIAALSEVTAEVFMPTRFRRVYVNDPAHGDDGGSREQRI